MLSSSTFPGAVAPRLARASETFGGRCEQEDISTAPQEPTSYPWFSQAHEVALGPRGDPAPAAQGSPPAHRLRLEEVGTPWAPRRLLSGAASAFLARRASGAAPSTWRFRTAGGGSLDPISFCSRFLVRSLAEAAWASPSVRRSATPCCATG